MITTSKCTVWQCSKHSHCIQSLCKTFFIWKRKLYIKQQPLPLVSGRQPSLYYNIWYVCLTILIHKWNQFRIWLFSNSLVSINSLKFTYVVECGKNAFRFNCVIVFTYVSLVYLSDVGHLGWSHYLAIWKNTATNRSVQVFPWEDTFNCLNMYQGVQVLIP